MEGEFTYTFTTEQLARGLRPSKRSPRNANFLYEARGVVGIDNVLQVLPELTKMEADLITDGFPYPQLFLFQSGIYLCGAATIYEYFYGTLYEKITVMPGVMWSAVDFYDFVYFTNGMSSVLRRATDGVWMDTTWLSELYPVASAACDYNGQVIIGGLGIHSPPGPPPIPKIDLHCHYDEEESTENETLDKTMLGEASMTTDHGTDQGPNAGDFESGTPSTDVEADTSIVSTATEKEVEGEVGLSYTTSVH